MLHKCSFQCMASEIVGQNGKNVCNRKWFEDMFTFKRNGFIRYSQKVLNLLTMFESTIVNNKIMTPG